MALGFVVVSHCHRRAIGKGVNIFAQYSLNGNNRLSPLCIPPILTDFNSIGDCLATFLHFHRKKKHS